jgi:phosphoenolpyruvate-protein kinase (PTS system EI component)
MASQSEAIPLLLGLGIKELSMPPAKLLEIKALICNLNVSKCREALDQTLHLHTAHEVHRIMSSLVQMNESG